MEVSAPALNIWSPDFSEESPNPKLSSDSQTYSGSGTLAIPQNYNQTHIGRWNYIFRDPDLEEEAE